MGRDIPSVYNPPDPDLSFVAGTGEIMGYSGEDPPHSGGDIAAAIRYLYAQARMVHCVPQVWTEDQAFGQASTAYSVTPDIQWLVKVDGSWEDLEVTIYYKGNGDQLNAFKVVLADNGESIELDSVDVGGNRIRKRVVWSGSNISDFADQSCVTLQLFTASDGVTANEVIGVFIRPLPLNGAIQPGKHYSGAFITPDSDQWVPDKPLTSDKITDMSSCLAALYLNRRCPKLVYGSVGTVVKHTLAMLVPLGGSSFERTHRVLALSGLNRTILVDGGVDQLLYEETMDLIVDVKNAGPAVLSPSPKLTQTGDIPMELGEYVVELSEVLDFKCITIEGV